MTEKETQRQPRPPTVDDDGNAVTRTGPGGLEIKSVKPYRTQDEYLYAMKEDLADWFNALYDLAINVDDFFEQLETGVILCQHANALQDFIGKQLATQSTGTDGGRGEGESVHSSRSNNNTIHRESYPALSIQTSGVLYRKSVQAGTFQSRDNISNFISWCRGVLVIPDTLLFETEDLVSRKNERNVVLCLLEVARRGARYGMLAPKLIQFEAEIDAEIAEEEEEEENRRNLNKQQQQQQRNQKKNASPSRKARPVIEVDMMSLDEMVRIILSACTCQFQFPMIRVSEGKYKFGESMTLIFLRILRNHVMVRIGGGWDTLECFLDRYDPCRCKSKDHRGGMAFIQKQTIIEQAKQDLTSASGRLHSSTGSSGSLAIQMPQNLTTSPCLWNPTNQFFKDSDAQMQQKFNNKFQENNSKLPSNHSRESLIGSSSSKRSPSPVSLPDAGGGNFIGRPRTQIISRRPTNDQTDGSNGSAAAVTRPTSASSLSRVNRTFRSIGDLPQFPSASTRGQSPTENGRRGLVRNGSSTSSLVKSRSFTSRTPTGGMVKNGGGGIRGERGALHRSSSADSSRVLCRDLSVDDQRRFVQTNRQTGSQQHAISVSERTKSSPNVVVLSKAEAADKTKTGSQSKETQLQKTRNGMRLGMTADKLLPMKWSPSSRSASVDVSPTDKDFTIAGKMRRSNSLQPSISFTLLHIPDYPDIPPEDEDLNTRMEMLYEQYRDVELGGLILTAREYRDDERVLAAGRRNKTPATVTRALSYGNVAHRSQEDIVRSTSTTSRKSLYRKDNGDLQLAVAARSMSARGPSTSRQHPACLANEGSKVATVRSSSLNSSEKRWSRKDGNTSAGRNPPTTERVPEGSRSTPRVSTRPGYTLGPSGVRGASLMSHRPNSSRPNSVNGKKPISRSRESILEGPTKLRNNAARLMLHKSLGDISEVNRKPASPIRSVNRTTKAGPQQNDIPSANGVRNPEETEIRRHDVGDKNGSNIRSETGRDPVKAKPRKDDRSGPPTRIPLPVGPGEERRYDVALKRFDSGVDITNISPTAENGSLQDDEDGSTPSTAAFSRAAWPATIVNEAAALSDRKLAFASPPPAAEDEYY